MDDLTAVVINRALAERERQKNELGYTADSGKKWKRGELAGAAATYAMPQFLRDHANKLMASQSLAPYSSWPWAEHYFKPDQTNTLQGRLRELEKASALLIAEMERVYQKMYDAIPNVEPDGVNYPQWVEAIKEYIVLERTCGRDVRTKEDLANLVDPDKDDWFDYYSSGFHAREAYVEMYYE